ncbi:OmpA family protein [Ruegeria sp. A3M17]|uniref:OmpA family protein n=1 Tax=Ruegeria sp. A3M17 TaxID=2267229 RepID=UPI000DE825C8|nr:OmpA family protein [Ruegeria sp. A3M17]RBW62531.1 hypothetical protein DS906_02425 [Ruegeria sp. A3M17]
MTRYTNGLFGRTHGPDPLEAFDSLYKREKTDRLMGRYGTRRPALKMPEPRAENAALAAEQGAPAPTARVFLKERVIKSWDSDLPVPEPLKEVPPEPPQQAEPSAEVPEAAIPAEPVAPEAAPPADEEVPLVEAGSFSVQDVGTMPEDADLTDDVDHIVEPRRPASEDAMRDAAVDDFLSMIDKYYKPAPPPKQDDVIEGEVVDPVDVVADVVEMSDKETKKEILPDVTPISLPAVVSDVAIQEGISRSTDTIAAIGLGLAVFQEFKAEFTKGDVSVSATPSRYIHPNTQPDSKFQEVVTDFIFHAYHPRVGISDQKFKIRIRTEIDGHDIRHAKISLVASESDDLIASSFSVNFTATAHSLPKEAMCKIRYDFSGNWDPKGTGDYDFNGMIDLWADGSVHIEQMVSEFDSPTFSSKKIKAVRIVSLKQVSVKKLPGKIRSTRNHTILFEKPKQSTLSDDQARALKTFVDGIPKGDISLVRAGRVPIVVDGFASTKGSVSDNQQLARERRDTVVSFLNDHIGSGAVFTGKSHGELDVNGPDDEESAEHRKVTVRIFTFKDE